LRFAVIRKILRREWPTFLLAGRGMLAALPALKNPKQVEKEFAAMIPA